MELADENCMPFCAISSTRALSVKRFLTLVWASSKFPLMPMTLVLAPFVVTICLSWIEDTPCLG